MPVGALENANLDLVPRYIAGPAKHEFVFTIVTLVASQDRYDRLVASLRSKGFTHSNTELLALDNRGGNSYDGYSYLRRAMLDARGQYIVLTHDDVELIHDDFERLVVVLDDLTELDSGWMVAGNAGGDLAGKLALHIDDPHGEWKIEEPRRCQSLDENFMVVRRDNVVLHSIDLEGFHFYGADLCLQAELQGGTSYVVPFLLRHHSGGKIDESFLTLKDRLEEKYSDFFRKRTLRVTTGTIHFGGMTISDQFAGLLGKFRRKMRLN